GGGHVAEGAPGGEDPAGGGVAQVDQVRQAGGPVGGHGGADLHHLGEGERALLHPGAAGGGRGEQRQPLGGGTLHRPYQPLGRGHPDGAGQEGELAGHDRDPAAVQGALAGDDRLVVAGPGAGGGQLVGVRRAGRGRIG